MIAVKIILIFLGVILLLFLWILLVPFVLRINTDKNLYSLKFVSIGGASLAFPEKEIAIRIRVFFFYFNIDPLKPPKKKEKPKKKKPRKKPSSRKPGIQKSLSAGKKMMVSVFRSFRVRKFVIDVDTGDVITNAWLYPLSVFLNNKRTRISVNNEGINSAEIEIRNQLIILLFIFLRFYFRLKRTT